MKTSLKQILFITVVMLCFFSCVTGKKETKNQPETTVQTAKEKRAFEKAENYLDAKRSDDTIYWGEGMANISEDIGKGKIEARKRAISALSEQIKVQVSSDVRLITSKNSIENGEAYSEKIKKSLEQKLETYTNQVLTNLKESKLFIDYPQKGTGTYVVFISKKEYEEKVKKDLGQKKQLVTDAVKSGDKAFAAKNYSAGIRQYVQAWNMNESFFGGIPVYNDIDGDGVTEELGMSIKERVRHFYSNLSLSLLNSGFQYNSDGAPESLPRVYVKYKKSQSEDHPVSGIYLKASFVKGSGEVNGIATGDYGEVEIPIVRIDPKNSDVSLNISVDFEKVPGIDSIYTGTGKSLLIKMKRKKAVALAVNFKNGKANMLPGSLKEKITSIILDKKFSVLDIKMKNSSDITKLKDVNADYIFFVKAKTSGGGAVGQYANMYAAYCGGEIKVYKLPHKNLIVSDTVKSAQGFGVSGESAGWDAFGKISGKMLDKVTKMVEKL